MLRLLSGAISLIREVEKAEHRLDKLREARLVAPEELPEVELLWEPPAAGGGEAAGNTARDESPDIAAADCATMVDDAAADLAATTAEDNRKIAAYAATNGLSWTQVLKQRRREQALTERQRKQAMQSQAA